MASNLLQLISQHPPNSIHTTPSTILTLSRHAPSFLSSSASKSDTPETWLLYENLFIICLRSLDDKSAQLCLDRLTERFGAENERVQALAGLYTEATSENRGELGLVLKQYEEVAKSDPTNTPITKRMVSLFKHLGQPAKAISALTSFLSNSPTDGEAWAELADLYFSQGLHAQAIFCLEEVILIYPNAYNIFARLGEVSYIGAQSGTAVQSNYADALRYYLRAVELCDDYLRAFYGIVVVTQKMLGEGSWKGDMSRETVQQLSQVAVSKLTEIVGNSRRRQKGWEGYDPSEVDAAATLLNEVRGPTAPK